MVEDLEKIKWENFAACKKILPPNAGRIAVKTQQKPPPTMFIFHFPARKKITRFQEVKLSSRV
jgi:hypothetical protein